MTNAPPSFPSQEAANAPPAGALVTLRALLSLVAKRALLSLVAKGTLFPLLRSSPLTYHQDNESPCLLYVSPARHSSPGGCCSPTLPHWCQGWPSGGWCQRALQRNNVPYGICWMPCKRAPQTMIWVQEPWVQQARYGGGRLEMGAGVSRTCWAQGVAEPPEAPKTCRGSRGVRRSLNS